MVSDFTPTSASTSTSPCNSTPNLNIKQQTLQESQEIVWGAIHSNTHQNPKPLILHQHHSCPTQITLQQSRTPFRSQLLVTALSIMVTLYTSTNFSFPNLITIVIWQLNGTGDSKLGENSVPVT